MAARKTVDVTESKELRGLAEEVATSGEECILLSDGRELAVISPAKKVVRRRTKTRADMEAFLSSAGSWKGLIDAEEFKKANRLSRSISRPHVDL